MINICLVMHQYFGGDPRARRYVDALLDAGAHVDVLCLRDPGQARTIVHPRLRVIEIPLGRGYGGLGRYVAEYAAALALFAPRLLALHCQRRYNIIQVHNIPDFLVLAALLPRLLGAKLVLDIRDPMPEFYMSKYAGRRVENDLVRFMRAQERLSAALAHSVVTANTSFERNLIQRGIAADKITVVNNWPDPSIFNRSAHPPAPAGPDHPFTLIYPGTIAPRYGLETAIRALTLLAPRIPHIRLRIIGPPNSHAQELAVLAKELGVSSAVEFAAPIAVDQVPMALAAANVGIYPALPDPHMNIATPTKVLEYAAMGLPIVASRVAILEELLPDDAVMFCEPGNVEQFAGAVLDLYEHPARARELVHNADSHFLNSYAWQTERSVYLNMLNRLLAPSSQALQLNDGSALAEHI